jgi:hypothetical protein
MIKLDKGSDSVEKSTTSITATRFTNKNKLTLGGIHNGKRKNTISTNKGKL